MLKPTLLEPNYRCADATTTGHTSPIRDLANLDHEPNRGTSPAAGFKLVLGTSVSCIAVGKFGND